ncbi:hypothetical protein [Phosphitispora sp. TUW77]|uniref:hypothetical protein n=1 Tax=Phosphitispora sp. TUW77 TaxID=3152361 RepID=UPI003AB332B8
MSKKMNQIRRGRVISTLSLSALLIITVILYLKAFMNRIGVDTVMGGILSTPAGILAVVIIMLAVGASLFTLARNIKKNKNVAKLNEEYDIVFEQIALYVGLSGLTFFEKRELNNEILNLFLEAQENNKKVDEVIYCYSFAPNSRISTFLGSITVLFQEKNEKDILGHQSNNNVICIEIYPQLV